MARLSIRLLGPFEVTLDDQLITRFESDKVRALLAYLAVNGHLPHRRENLAGLLWPEMPDGQARANLRYALADLRSAIGDREAEPPFLDITRRTIRFNLGGDAWVDIQAFLKLLAGGDIRGRAVQELEEAVGLVRGPFLEGLSPRECLPFEEWALLQREHLARLHQSALHRLTTLFEAQGAYESALRYAWCQVELEPYDEEAQNQLMNLLALTGQRSAALTQYDALRQMLRAELGVDPSAETHALYRRILSGEIAPEEEVLRDRIIRGYDLLEQIGEGSFGAVYRALQPVLGREVAVKIIRSEYANRPSFIRRFEAEAQMVARLEHPHIVPLYDFWREPEGAYLVMRLYPKGSLKDALSLGGWEAKAAMRLVDQVASALAVAHSQGVIHRDVKPANILLDGTGNAYLSDFSIAREVVDCKDSTVPETLTISPEYAAPEQWQATPLTPLVDVYSLGMVLHEVLTGRHPFVGTWAGDGQRRQIQDRLPSVSSICDGVPTAVDEVIDRATAPAPRDRYPDAYSLAEAFRQAMEASVGKVFPAVEIPRGEPENPFKGLQPFREADAHHFFGRDSLVQVLSSRLTCSPGDGQDGRRFLAVVGPSGIGKSSLVRAGLIPALRGGSVAGSEDWYIVTMQPGTMPLEELAAALVGVAVRGVEELQEALGQDERGLLRAADLVLPVDSGAKGDGRGELGERRGELLLVVDQFEELYAPAVRAAEREKFLCMLNAAVMEVGSRVRVIITLRADYYDRPLRHRQFSQLLRRRTEVVVPLSAEELAEAIQGPAVHVGVDLEPGLVGAIVADVAEQPGALPMFQYALTELFERREGRLLTWKAYQAIGGVTGALARRAEAVYSGLDDTEQVAARQVFLRLVTPSEGTEETRRRVRLEELRLLQTSGLWESNEVLDAVLGAFGQARLLLFDRDPATRTPTVEVAHEALLQAWGRLRTWLEESWADLRMEQLLAVATGEWLAANRDPGFLLWGTRLAQFEGWAAGSTVALTREERAYLEASVSARRAREAEREARQQRELDAARALADEQQRRAEAERQRAEEQAKSARRMRRRALYLVGALLLAVLLAVMAGAFGQLASRSANLAATREVQAVDNANLAATGQALAVTRQAVAEAEAALRATAQADAEAETALRGTAQAEAAGETALRATAQAEAEEEASLRATAQADAVEKREVAEAQARIATSRELAAAALDVLDVDPEAGALLALQAIASATTIEAENALHKAVPYLRLLQTFAAHTDRISDLSVNPTGTLLATASQDGTVKLWQLPVPANQGVSEAAQPSPSMGDPVLTLYHPGGANCVAFDPTGGRLATCGSDGMLTVWQVSADDRLSAEEIYVLTAHEEPISTVAFSPDGAQLATGSRGAMAKVWDATSGDLLYTLEGHDKERSESRPWETGIIDLDFSADGSRLVTCGADGTSKIWDISAETEGAGRRLQSLSRRAGAILSVAMGPGDALLATASERGKINIWDIASDGKSAEVIVQIPQHGESVAFSPDGTRLAVIDIDGLIGIWDVATGEQLLVLQNHTGGWLVAFTPDGERLFTAGRDGTAKLWDLSPSRELAALVGTGAGVAFSPDGKRLVTGAPSGAILWQLAAGNSVTIPFSVSEPEADADQEAGSGDRVFGVSGIAISPDGKRVATAGIDGITRIWDAGSGEELLSLDAHSGRVWDVDFDPSGLRLATAGGDGTARVWDAITGRELLTITAHTERVYSVDFHPAGTRLATGSWDGTAKVWDVSRLLGTQQYADDQAIDTSLDAGEALYTLTSDQDIYDVAFSPDGESLALSDSEGRVGVWALAEEVPQRLVELRGHTAGVTRIAFSPDGTRLATASADTTARVWDAITGQELLNLRLHDEMLTGITFSPDGRLLATTGAGVTRIYALELEDIVTLAQARLTRSLTNQECRRYLHVDECPVPP